MLDNNVEATEESSNGKDDDHNDDYDPETADTLELADAKAAEYTQLKNL